MVGRRLANMDLPVPGGPYNSRLWPQRRPLPGRGGRLLAFTSLKSFSYCSLQAGQGSGRAVARGRPNERKRAVGWRLKIYLLGR